MKVDGYLIQSQFSIGKRSLAYDESFAMAKLLGGN
jgi:hypothetical protein